MSHRERSLHQPPNSPMSSPSTMPVSPPIIDEHATSARVLNPLPRISPFQAMPSNSANAHNHGEQPGVTLRGTSNKPRTIAPRPGNDEGSAAPTAALIRGNVPLNAMDRNFSLRVAEIKAMVYPDGATPETSNQTLKFANRREAALALIDRNIDSLAPKEDTTIPSTDEARGRWVLRLLVAMKNRRNILDKKSRAVKRWALPEPGENIEPFYGDDEMERVCWEVVYITEQLHRHGPQILSIFDPKTYEELKKDSVFTFEERMEFLIKMVCFLKAKCDSFMKGTCTEELIAAVRTKFAMALGNRKHNDRRAPLIQYGRMHCPGQRPGLGGMDDEVIDASDDTAIDDGLADHGDSMASKADENISMDGEDAEKTGASVSSASPLSVKRPADAIENETATVGMKEPQPKRICGDQDAINGL